MEEEARCCVCGTKRTLVSAQPIAELLRRLKKCEQEKKRVERKLQNRFKKIQQRESDKFQIEQLRIRCEEVLKPNFKRITELLISDKTQQRKVQQEQRTRRESVQSHTRKTERMEKYVHKVRNQIQFESKTRKNEKRLIDDRLQEAELLLRVDEAEFETPSTSASMSSTMVGTMVSMVVPARLTDEEEKTEEALIIANYKLSRTQQYIATLGAIAGPRTPPLPAQIPLKMAFRLKLPKLYAGVRVNLDQSQSDWLGEIEQLMGGITRDYPTTQQVAEWVEEDDLIDESWEALTINDAPDATTSRSSNLLSTFWTGWTGGWTNEPKPL